MPKKVSRSRDCSRKKLGMVEIRRTKNKYQSGTLEKKNGIERIRIERAQITIVAAVIAIRSA